MIDTERLRNDMIDDCYAAAYAGGFPAALNSASDIQDMSDEKLQAYAITHGVNLSRYAIDEDD